MSETPLTIEEQRAFGYLTATCDAGAIALLRGTLDGTKEVALAVSVTEDDNGGWLLLPIAILLDEELTDRLTCEGRTPTAEGTML